MKMNYVEAIQSIKSDENKNSGKESQPSSAAQNLQQKIQKLRSDPLVWILLVWVILFALLIFAPTDWF